MHDPTIVRDQGVLQWLHPNTFTTLVNLEISINFDMHPQTETPDISPQIRDPYFGLTSDGLLLKLTALQELEIMVSIEAGADLKFDWKRSFGDQWGALDRMLVSSKGELASRSLKGLSIWFAPRGDNYHLDRVMSLGAYALARVYPLQFSRLSALRKKGPALFSFKYSVSSSIKKKLMAAQLEGVGSRQPQQ